MEENRRRGGRGPEFELLDTGIFDDDRYFDVFVEYAKADPEDIAIRITVWNRGPERRRRCACSRTSGSATPGPGPERPAPEPYIRTGEPGRGSLTLVADERAADPLRGLADRVPAGRALPLRSRRRPAALHLQRDERPPRLGARGAEPAGVREGRVPPSPGERRGLRQPRGAGDQGLRRLSARRRSREAPPCLRLRLTPERLDRPPGRRGPIVDERKAEADEFYAAIQPAAASADEKLVQRQALASLLWTKQIYLFDVGQLAARRQSPLAPARLPQAHPQLPLAASELHARHVHARQVGVPLVRGLGPGLPLRGPRPRGRAVRQGAALAAALRAVPASLRADPRLRVGVLGPEPARAGLGGLARLQHGPHPLGQGRTARSSSAASTSC